ncbi:hypothetical protein AB4Z48_04935 [Cupriavidus sp. 2TAF22]
MLDIEGPFSGVHDTNPTTVGCREMGERYRAKASCRPIFGDTNPSADGWQ